MPGSGNLSQAAWDIKAAYRRQDGMIRPPGSGRNGCMAGYSIELSGVFPPGKDYHVQIVTVHQAKYLYCRHCVDCMTIRVPSYNYVSYDWGLVLYRNQAFLGYVSQFLQCVVLDLSNPFLGQV